MTPEELKAQKDALLEDIKGQVKGLIADATKESITKAELDAKVDELNKSIADNLNNEDMATLKESVDKLLQASTDNAAAIKAFTEEQAKTVAVQPKTLRQAIKAAILEKKDIVLTDKNDDYGQRLSLKEYFTEKGHQQTPVFTIKAAVDMLQSNIVQSEVADIRLTELDPNRVGIPLSVYPNVMDWMPARGISKPYMSVLVAYSYEDGAGTKTEGSAPSKSSFLFKTVQFPAFTIATYFTLSDETLDDLEEALDEISIVGPEKIQDNVDSQILGSSGDDSTALAGLLTANKHTAFTASTYANTVAGANAIDLIGKMKLAVLANKYRPDTVQMNPDDIDSIAALKDQLDNSILDRRVKFDAMGNPVGICGMVLRASTSITANEVVVMDSSKTVIGKRRDMTMEIGYNGTDLTEGQKTVVIKVRVAFAVRDKAGIMYSSDMTSDVSTIDIVND